MDNTESNIHPEGEVIVIDSDSDDNSKMPIGQSVVKMNMEEEQVPSPEVLELRQKVAELQQKDTENSKKVKELEGRVDELTSKVAQYEMMSLNSQQSPDAKTVNEEPGMNHEKEADTTNEAIDSELSKKRKRKEETKDDEKEEEEGKSKKRRIDNEEKEVEEEGIEPLVEDATGDREHKKKRSRSRNGVLIVKNLSPMTERKALADLFKQKFDIVSARAFRQGDELIPTGIVHFWTYKEASEALKSMQGALLHGHAIALSFKEKRPLDIDRWLLILRKVPKEASFSEVESIFSSFSGFKSLHMPQNPDGSHRGFGFVDFDSKATMGRTYSSLQRSTYLHGKKFIMEYAKSADASVEEERKLYSDSLRKAEEPLEAIGNIGEEHETDD